ncbi:MAG: hypothetical protein M3P08_20365 [Thermoproteota archaeon]|jgi:hypothetical protein|nr:hypothetical protein [Thermoproteota archaeon]
MANDKTADIQARIEKLLKDEPLKSYSKEEIIDKLSDSYPNMEVERMLGEMEVSSSMTNSQSHVDSTCRDGTVYFQWR